MNNQTSNNLITISKRNIRRQGGFVILPLREYEELREKAIPTYCMEGKEAEELDKLVEEGLKDYRDGKTIKASSMRNALKIYDRKRNKKH